jgi:hypothetical protein
MLIRPGTLLLPLQDITPCVLQALQPNDFADVLLIAANSSGGESLRDLLYYLTLSAEDLIEDIASISKQASLEQPAQQQLQQQQVLSEKQHRKQRRLHKQQCKQMGQLQQQLQAQVTTPVIEQLLLTAGHAHASDCISDTVRALLEQPAAVSQRI